MSRTKTDRSKRAIFGVRFSEQLKKWQSVEKSRTQEDFGKLFDPPVSRVSVNRWCRGETIPKPKCLKQICEIFAVEENYFDTTTATHDELYKYSSAFQTALGKKHVEFAKLIGLDLNLIRALSDCVGFDNLFPLYSPIDKKSIEPQTLNMIYERRDLFADSAPVEEVDEGLRFLQVEKSGKRKTFHRCDLVFLKEVQDQIVNYVEFLFYQREKEMKEEVKQFNQDLIEVTVNGKPVPDSEKEKYLNMRNEKPKKIASGSEFETEKRMIIESKQETKNVCITQKGISKDFILKHDRFAEYNYIFPDETKPDWYSIYADKPRKATQEDWDRFFDGEIILEDGGKANIKKGGE